MKRIRILMKKSIALLLALAMVMSLSAPVYATETAENEVAETDSVSTNLINPAVDWALEKLAGGALSKIGGKSVNEGLNLIYGDDTDTVLNSLQEMDKTRFDTIDKQLGDMQTQLKEINKKIDTNDLGQKLDDFTTFMTGYQTLYSNISTMNSRIGNDPEKAKEYLTELYNGEQGYIVNSYNIQEATINLGNELTRTHYNGYNIFGTFDTLDRYTNHWEHQGYNKREDFRNEALAIYSLFSAMSQLACQTVIEDPNSAKLDQAEANCQLNVLRNDAATISAMNERCAVVEHPDLRIYRNVLTQIPDFVFDKNVVKSYLNTKQEDGSFDLSAVPNSFMRSMTGNDTPWGKKDGFTTCEIWTYQAAEETYHQIYTEYGGQTSLYHIFFDADKGNFANASGLSEGTSFAGNYYRQTDVSDHTARTLSLMFHAINNNGQPYEDELGYCKRVWKYLFPDPLGLLKPYGFEDNDLIYGKEYFNVMTNRNTVTQGDLNSPAMDPGEPTDGLISGMASSYNLPYTDGVTLSVVALPGDSYQWQVNKGNGFEVLSGETNATYTLPILEAAMNGYAYSCSISENGKEGSPTVASPATLVLTGEGVPPVQTVHEVGNVSELTAALAQVTGGDWDEHTLKLTADIDYPLPITLNGCGVNIDLNGYTLNVQPDSSALKNIEPDGSTAAIAAVYTDNKGFLTLTGDGALNVVAGTGVTTGVYAAGGSAAQVNAVSLTNSGSAVYAVGGSTVTATSVTAAGEYVYGVDCAKTSTVRVDGGVTVSGKSACGTYLDSMNETTRVSIGGDLAASGENSRGALLNGEKADLQVTGNVAVTDGVAGISVGKGTAVVEGSITAPADAVHAWNNANVTVKGNVMTTDSGARTVAAAGAVVQISGNVNATGTGSTGISAAAYDLAEPAVGATVTVDGKIKAAIPLMIAYQSVDENSHAATTTKADYNTFTDSINTVWAHPDAFVKTDTINYSYRTHVQNLGWQDWKTDGNLSGTAGESLRLEAIEIAVENPGRDLGVEYSTHIQNKGWQEFKANGVMSGTSGESLRLEAIKINLTGKETDQYDIYYRVHAQNLGWLDWAVNGAESGTAGFGYRLEGIEIKVIPKGDPAPGATANPFKENTSIPHSR